MAVGDMWTTTSPKSSIERTLARTCFQSNSRDPLVNRIKNSLELAITFAGADHEVVGNRVHVTRVQHDDIAGQFVFGKLRLLAALLVASVDFF